MNHEPSAIAAPAIKAATSLGAGVGAYGFERTTKVAEHTFNVLGITSWGEAAAAAAFLYSAGLILEFWWKKFWRPLFERLGWLKPRKHRKIVVDTGFDQLP